MTTTTPPPTVPSNEQTLPDIETGPSRKVRFPDGILIAILITITGVLLAQTILSAGSAPTPEVFGTGYSLDEAMGLSSKDGTPVFVVASADWCGPCQAYKRGALADERVATRIGESMIPVYINVDDDPQAAESLGVMSIPLTAILVDGKIVARREGRMGSDELLEMVEIYAR